MSKYDNVTAKEYFEQKRKMLDTIGRKGGCCDGVSCARCPLDGIVPEKNFDCISCAALEIENTEKAIEIVMDYEIPVDWSKVLVDTKIMVKLYRDTQWTPRYFAKYENGKVFAFSNGATSFTANGHVCEWDWAKLYEGE